MRQSNKICRYIAEIKYVFISYIFIIPLFVQMWELFSKKASLFLILKMNRQYWKTLASKACMCTQHSLVRRSVDRCTVQNPGHNRSSGARAHSIVRAGTVTCSCTPLQWDHAASCFHPSWWRNASCMWILNWRNP